MRSIRNLPGLCLLRIIEKLLVVFLPIFLLSVVSVTLLSRQAAERELIAQVDRAAEAAAADAGAGLDETDARAGVYETARRISKDVLWIVTIVNLLVLGISLFYIRTILKPARLMSRAAEQIAGGQLGETVPVVSHDEMGDLAHSFNHMSRELALTTVSADFLDSVVDSVRDVLVIMNTDGSIRRINRVTGSLLGYEEGELLGRSAGYLFEGFDGLFTSEGLFDLDLEEGVVSREGQLRRQDGSTLPVLLSVAAFPNREGRLAGFIATAADLTERIRAEEEVHESLRQKKILLKEIHHRVKNNLQIISSLLNLQTDQGVDGATRALFDDSQSRIKAMALIHEKLYLSEDLSQVDFQDYAHSLTMSLYQTYRPDDLTLDLRIEAEPIMLGIDQAIPCGLIINELVANAMKHGFRERQEGVITVKVRAEEGGEGVSTCRLDIIDDGVGMPSGASMQEREALGLKLVSILAQQLDGQFDYEPTTLGTHAVVRFELAPAV